MKKLILSTIVLVMSCLCFAQVKSFDIMDIDGWDDIEDNIILENKTRGNIAVATLYGVREVDCPNGFNLSDFISKNEDDTISISSKAEKIITFRGLNSGKSQKKDISKKYSSLAASRFRYFIIHVEEPVKFEFSITDLKEKRDDLFISLSGNGAAGPEKEYVYIERSSSSSPSYSSTSSTSTSSDTQKILDSLNETSKQLTDWSQGKCSDCKGTGVCPECKGSGKYFNSNCWKCGGTGKCRNCGGDGDWIH